jgi:hypothetical protein
MRLLLALGALALVAASSNAMAFGHGGSMKLLASYQPRIDAVTDSSLREDLNARMFNLQLLFSICSQRQTHSQALLDSIHAEMLAVAHDLALPETRIRQDMAQAFTADAIEMAANQ